MLSRTIRAIEIENFMKKILILTAAVLLVAGFGLGAIGSYIYISASRDCSQMIARAEDKNRTAVAAAGTAQAAELKKDAEYARKGAVMSCENAKERKTNSLLFGLGALALIIFAAALLFFARRINRQLE